MKSAGTVQVLVVRRRGRPRLGDVRIETIIPQDVYNRLVREESRSGVYRTRIAAHVLCSWAGTTAPDCRSTYAS
jgi:hypothetical protein